MNVLKTSALLGLLALLAAAEVGGASAGRSSTEKLRLNLSFRITPTRLSTGNPLIVGSVGSVSFTHRTWAMRASFRNVTQADVWIGTRIPCSLGVSPTAHPRQNLLPAHHATFARPTIPVWLRPGERWAGVCGGYGPPRPGRYLSVSLGGFAGKQLCNDCLSVGWRSRWFRRPR